MKFLPKPSRLPLSMTSVGMSSSKRIIAFNKDPQAPIFEIADLGIVGDALVILPKLIDEIERVKVKL